MLNYPEISARVFNTPLLAEPRKGAAFLRGLGPRLLQVDSSDLRMDAVDDDDDVAVANPAFASLLGDDVAESIRDGYRDGYAVRDGVAIIPVRGVLIHRGAWIGQSSGQTSYEGLRAQLDTALEDDRVKAIALEIDSFGGEVAGCFDLADRIREVRGAKPVRAFVADHAYSAAYALASQADRIVMSRTGGVGSIGVVCMHVDVSGAMTEAGVNVSFIHAGKHKVDGNQYAPLPESVREEWQADMESLRELFAETVSAGRPALTVKAALDTEARCLSANQAIELGLADDVSEPRAAFEKFVQEIQTGAVPARTSAPLAHKPGGPAMAKQKNAVTASEEETDTLPEEELPEGTDSEEEEEASETSESEEEASEDENDPEAPSASGERKRIAAILDSPQAQANPGLAKHFAFSTDMSSKDAIAAMKASAPSGGRLAGLMDAAENPNLSSGGGGPATAKSSADMLREKYGKK